MFQTFVGCHAKNKNLEPELREFQQDDRYRFIYELTGAAQTACNVTGF